MSIKTHRFGKLRYVSRDIPENQIITEGPLAFAGFNRSFWGVLAAVFLILVLFPGLSRGHITEANRALLETSPTGQFIYTVESGDSLWKIFLSLKKDLSHWPEFLAENGNFPLPDQIFPGEKVRIPIEWISLPPPGNEVRPVSAGKLPNQLFSALPFPGTASAEVVAGEAELVPLGLLPDSETLRSPSPDGFKGSPRGWEISLNAVLFLLVLWLLSRFYPGAVPRIRWVFVAFTLALGGRYIFWRATETLNTGTALSAVFSWMLLAAEVYGFFAVLFFYIQVAKPTRRESHPLNPEKIPSVDVFVATYNEPTDLLKRTLVACRALDYPKGRKTVFVLDDGGRPEVRRLAERLGCRYIARPVRDNAKAGNLNFGLGQSEGELVLVLDCDHVPVSSFLKETVGFFYDSTVAFVQTPHYFYNPDTFQRNLRLEDKIVNEQDLFFRIIQEGRDGFNSSFFAGSGGVFRRSSLEDIGGFQTKTLTEDLHTSMVLHARGARSVYLNKVLAAGLAPESYGSYLRQRQRWAKGGFQVFLLDNPLWRPGLSLMQRVQYFGAIFYFFHGLSRLVYLAAPLSFLLFSIPPLQAEWKTLLSNFIPYYFASLMAFTILSRGFRNPFWSDLYETAVTFSISRTFFQTLLKPRKTEFCVTPKGSFSDRAHVDWSSVLPHGVLLVLILGGLVAGGYRLLTDSLPADPFIISGFWSAYNTLLLLGAIVVAIERPQKRYVPRLRRKISCQLTRRGESWSGTTTDLSESGLGLSFEHSVTLPAFVDVRLISNFGEETRIKGEIIRNDRLHDRFDDGKFSIGIRFLDISDSVQQSLIRQMYSSPSSWTESVVSPSKTWGSLGLMATSFFRVFLKNRNLRRLWERHPVRLRCGVGQGERVVRGITEDIGNMGLSARFPSPLELGKEISVQIQDEGRVVFSARGELLRLDRTKKGEWFGGIRFYQPEELDLTSLSLKPKL